MGEAFRHGIARHEPVPFFVPVKVDRQPVVPLPNGLLPEHLHCIWTLPPCDADFPARWHDIKSRFSARIPHEERRSARRIHEGERGIWQRRCWEYAIGDDRDFARHVDGIHFNPVEHGHAARAADWPNCSFQRFVAKGLLPLDWAAHAEVRELNLE
jgi:putative transposase